MQLTASLVLYKNDPEIVTQAIKSLFGQFLIKKSGSSYLVRIYLSYFHIEKILAFRWLKLLPLAYQYIFQQE
jgi:hypothetical protein